MSGVNRCQGMPWREELDGKELRGALGGERDLELRGSTVFWNIVDLESTLFQHILQLLYYADFKGVV